jgi:hypothetical protein
MFLFTFPIFADVQQRAEHSLGCAVAYQDCIVNEYYRTEIFL